MRSMSEHTSSDALTQFGNFEVPRNYGLDPLELWRRSILAEADRMDIRSGLRFGAIIGLSISPFLFSLTNATVNTACQQTDKMPVVICEANQDAASRADEVIDWLRGIPNEPTPFPYEDWR